MTTCLGRSFIAVRKVGREYDLIVRHGGDEFVCGLLDLDIDDALDRFEKARKDPAGHRLGFSVGLAVSTATRPSMGSLTERTSLCTNSAGKTERLRSLECCGLRLRAPPITTIWRRVRRLDRAGGVAPFFGCLRCPNKLSGIYGH